MRDMPASGAHDPWDDDAAPVRNTRAARAARAAVAAPPPEPTPAQKLAQKRERRAAVNAAHEIRIIGGQWRRSLLPVPDMPGPPSGPPPRGGGLRPSRSRMLSDVEPLWSSVLSS